jgi:HD superfamily phosphohydrolase
MDVPITERVRAIIDSPPMRRLATISQLGLVALVYPGATHSRLEHSLGVYANALRLLDHLTLCEAIDNEVALDAFLLAALVHDVGHWPYCHPIEDMGESIVGQVKHEDRVESILRESQIAECLKRDWQCSADDVMSILRPKSFPQRSECQLSAHEVSFFASCLSGPIDIDKLDYLQRDSLHAGVPYGRNFDPERIVAALCPHPYEAKLAIGEKGRTAAEMMVFGRYVMFSEVYWHHTVRAATAMLQRALFDLQQEPSVPSASFDLSQWAELSEANWIASLQRVASDSTSSSSQTLVNGLFGPARMLLKRTAEFNVESGSEVHALLARRPYWWLVACSRFLAVSVSQAIGRDVDPSLVLIDAPPVKLEVDINIDVIGRGGEVMTLGNVSPVASVLANRQFDNHVKRVRVFVPAEVRETLRRVEPQLNESIQAWLIAAAKNTEMTIA